MANIVLLGNFNADILNRNRSKGKSFIELLNMMQMETTYIANHCKPT